MTRDEMIDLLTNALSSADVESQEILGDGGVLVGTVSALVTPTGRLLLAASPSKIGAFQDALKSGGAHELSGFVVDLLLDQIKCAWCPPNLEERTIELVGQCESAVSAEQLKQVGVSELVKPERKSRWWQRHAATPSP